jgi:hypothetical protein
MLAQRDQLKWLKSSLCRLSQHSVPAISARVFKGPKIG